MSLFNSQTIFSILVTLLIGAALYYYIKYKYRILELTQREQAKVLQSVIMSMNNNNHNLVSMIQGKSNEELVSESIAHDMNRFSEVNKTNELIDVSDDDDSESESGSDSGSDSESGSESGSDSENDDDIEGGNNNNNNSTTKKILFTGNHDSHLVEHLEGPDVKIIELSHPLYSKNENDNDNDMYNKNTNHDDEDHDDRDDNDDEYSSDSDSESDSESVTSDIEGHEIHEIHEIHDIKENTVTNEMNNQNDLETENISDNISEIVSVDNSLDNLLVKAVFRNKDSETHADYNSMNVQSLRQLLKNKLASDGSNMSESSINKLTKKELIKHLS